MNTLNPIETPDKNIEFLSELAQDLDRRFKFLPKGNIPPEHIQQLAKLRMQALQIETNMYAHNRFLVQSQCEHTFVTMTTYEDGQHGPQLTTEVMCTKCYLTKQQ